MFEGPGLVEAQPQGFLDIHSIMVNYLDQKFTKVCKLKENNNNNNHAAAAADNDANEGDD